VGGPPVLRDNPRVDRIRWMVTGSAPALSQNPAYRPTHRHDQRSALGNVWRRVAAEVELPEWATFHDLRHFYASLLIARGCSVKAVPTRLGHQSAVETLDTYSHLWPDTDDETRDAVDSVLKSIAV
jgi:integrase